jgi:2-oxoisovalerate dehydrogenase E2 component (dihydrolipoyl transacylase)
LQWFVAKGESVKQFDRISEVQSDKATVEITSRYDEIIASLNYERRDMATVGSPQLFLERTCNNQPEKRNISCVEEGPLLPIPNIVSGYQLATDDSKKVKKVLTSPAIRKLAKEYNLDLSTILGQGPRDES